MKKILKRIAIISVSLGIVTAMALPMIKAYADSKGEGDYELTLSVDSNSDWVTSLTINGYPYSAGDTYRDSDGEYFMTIELHVPNESLREDTSVRPGGGSGAFNIQQAGSSEDWEGTHRKFTYTINYTAPQVISHLSLNPYSEDHGGQPGPGPVPQGNTEATVTMRALTPEGYYDRNVYGEGNKIVNTERYYYKNTYPQASFAINRGQFYQFQPSEEVENEDYSQVTYYYDYDEEKNPGTVDITVMTLWNWRLVNGYVNINGVNYPIEIDYDDKKSYLDHYGGQMIGFEIKNVTKADAYDIKLDAMQTPHEAHIWIGNFLWTSDPDQMYEKDCRWDEEAHRDICEIKYDENGDPIPGRDYIGHSGLAIIAVEYTVGNDIDGYVTYSCNTETATCSQWVSSANGKILDGEEVSTCNISDANCDAPYVEYDNNGSAGYEDGSLVVPAGARVTMQVIPEYGYQVMNVNMDKWGTAADLGYFTFTIPEGAAYFMAEVVETEDKVVAGAEAVADGAIDLGDNQTTIDHGTAKLEVNDVDLSNEDIAGFENASGDYHVGTYLDISLYNITCKGGATCVGTDADSWSEQIDELNEEATITLQLEEGVDGNDVVIVHQKHDGTYEIIPTTYDPVTHTITFKTSSFSNYAIASRTVTSPETGEMTSQSASAISGNKIFQFATIFVAVSIIAIIVTRKTKANK